MITGTPTVLRSSVATPSDLAGTPDDQYQDGDFGYTSSPKQTWQIDRSSSAVPNGTTVLETFSGNGRWLARNFSTSIGAISVPNSRCDVRGWAAGLCRDAPEHLLPARRA